MYTYNTIPARLFFEISKTDNINLLGYATQKENKHHWEEIAEEYAKKTINNYDLIFDLMRKIRSLSCKYVVIQNCIFLLRRKPDQELTEILQEYGYKADTKEDLDKIEKNLNSLEVRIANLENQLEQLQPEKENKTFDFSKNYIAMCLVLETTPKNSDEVLLCDYVNLIEFTEQKLKVLKN